MQPSDVAAVLADLANLHERKSHDYAQDSNPFSNFEEAAASAGVSVDTVFAVMMALQGIAQAIRAWDVLCTQASLR